MSTSPAQPSITPLSPDTQASTISLDDFSDSQFDLDQLEHAVEELPDSEPEDHLLSPSPADDASLATADENIVSNGDATGSALAPASAGVIRTARPRTDVDRQIAALEPRTRPWELQNLLNLSGQTLGVASSASSVGFSFAREATSLSLNIAKRLTQVAVALPAMAIDAAAGTAPGSGNPTAATIAHKSVGGLFDLLTTLAVGGIDLGSALTSAGLGAASTGIEGVRRSLGSEVVKALGQFVKLVQREWHAQDDCLPPGGIPGFGATGVTRALIVWICIQMVTREDYEKKLLKELQEIDVDALRIEIEEEQRAAASRAPQGGGIDAASTSGANVGTVRITSETSDQDGGEVIGAEIGSSQAGVGIGAPSKSSESLSNKEAMQGLLRYSSMVLAVYGGTALAWLGRLPQTEAEAARAASARPSSSTSAPASGLSSSSALPADGVTREQDEEQFLEAAAMMDLPEEDRESLHLKLEKERDRRGMPGGFGARSESVDDAASVVFNADDPEAGNKTTGAAPGTPSGRASGADSLADRQHANGSSTAGEAPTKSYSYLNIIAGEHDEELFHRVSKLERQHVQTGSYREERPVADEVLEETIAPPTTGPRIPRPSKPRYYVVTDHKSRKIILVLRGSLSLGDIAADLTCESREFYFPDPAARGEVDPAASTAPEAQQTNSVPFPGQDASTSARAAKFIDTDQSELPLVHEGMYETSLGVGAINRPVHRAVRSALLANAGYNLDIAGHSLGAGVASLLAIMWANPETTLTTTASGLPPGRKLHAYCYGCPATMSASLGRRCHKLITSYVYSYDFICRLSLGSIQDIRNAAAWILWEDQQESLRQRQQQQSRGTSSTAAQNGEAPFDPSDRSTPLRVAALLTRAFEHQAGRLDSSPETKAAVETDFLALRRTLEANMRNVELFVPGQLFYFFKGQDFLVDGEQEQELKQDGAAGSSTTSSAGAVAEAEAGALVPSSTAPSPTPRKKVKGTKQRGFILRPAPAEGGGRGGRVENVFDQVIFSRDLISCHMPSVYDAALKGMIGRK
ncbi:hypothetical protein BCV69DRAFT_279940 [Microstroma glucosiphilum]|uniref:sn-1-specific diacylglycerol lipase n=1 Tax=Pseudomicrostroma glucosiphilum TaxID=1684307 RepID=A0A316ULF4_9BASI|nr:hypothetical protein BCV69DRAFT_279940 [Pseudomicrostroma glucosiphilum]PWN24035.1 hypothetical protein BCV69DRAFT_279940 [Pseudomicrostroma glucosiphilum]